MDAFAAAYAQLQEGQKVPLQYYVFSERHRKRTALLYIHKKWCAPRPAPSCAPPLRRSFESGGTVNGLAVRHPHREGGVLGGAASRSLARCCAVALFSRRSPWTFLP